MKNMPQTPPFILASTGTKTHIVNKLKKYQFTDHGRKKLNSGFP
jgi:hypothetical protein